MRKKNKKASVGKVLILVLVSVILCSPASSQAKEKKKGAMLLLEKKTGEILQGELLFVKGNELVLLDHEKALKFSLDINEINDIRITKKSKFFKGLGNGLLFGGAGGVILGLLGGDDHSGILAFSAETKALFGGLFFGALGAAGGGIIGAVSGIDESVSLEGMSSEDVADVLKKLTSKARYASESLMMTGVPAEMKINEEITPAEKVPVAQKKIRIKNKSFKTSLSQKPPLFHLSFIPGYTGSLGIASFKRMIDTVGFDADEYHPAGWWHSSPYTVNYPEVTQNQVINIKEIRAEYLIGRKLAVGLSYAPLGHHRIAGRKIMPNKDYRGIISESFLSGKYSGSAYFLTVSLMPIPDTFTKKFSTKIGAGVGYSRMNAEFMTSRYKIWGDEGAYSASDRIDRADYSTGSICFLLSGELAYYFNRTLSLGVNVDYKYVPLKVDEFQLEAPYNYYAEKGGDLLYDSETIYFPSRRMNLGGVAVGLNIGLHF